MLLVPLELLDFLVLFVVEVSSCEQPLVNLSLFHDLAFQWGHPVRDVLAEITHRFGCECLLAQRAISPTNAEFPAAHPACRHLGGVIPHLVLLGT